MTSRAVTSHHQGADQLDSLTRVVKCNLDEDQCLSLHDILASFQTAINEEQAWALCYQTVKCFGQHYQASQCYLITDPSHLYVHKDGFVHQKSLFPKTIKSGTAEGMFPFVSFPLSKLPLWHEQHEFSSVLADSFIEKCMQLGAANWLQSKCKLCHPVQVIHHAVSSSLSKRPADVLPQIVFGAWNQFPY